MRKRLLHHWNLVRHHHWALTSILSLNVGGLPLMLHLLRPHRLLVSSHVYNRHLMPHHLVHALIFHHEFLKYLLFLHWIHSLSRLRSCLIRYNQRIILKIKLLLFLLNLASSDSHVLLQHVEHVVLVVFFLHPGRFFFIFLFFHLGVPFRIFFESFLLTTFNHVGIFFFSFKKRINIHRAYYFPELVVVVLLLLESKLSNLLLKVHIVSEYAPAKIEVNASINVPDVFVLLILMLFSPVFAFSLVVSVLMLRVVPAIGLHFTHINFFFGVRNRLIWNFIKPHFVSLWF